MSKTVVSLLVNEELLREWERLCRLRLAHLVVCHNSVAFRVDFGPRSEVVVLHVLLADCPAIPHSLDALAQAVRLDSVKRRLGNEDDAARGQQ